jgi:hypothetical protein
MEKRVRILAAACIAIALASLVTSAYMGYMLNARLTVLEKPSLIVYNNVVALRADGSNQFEVNTEDFHLWMSVAWQDPDSKAIQLRMEMRQSNVFSTPQACCATGDLYYLALDDVKTVSFRGYTVQVWFMNTAAGEPPAAFLKVAVVNIGYPQAPIGQETGVVFSGDVIFAEGVREDFSVTAADFNFSLHVNPVGQATGKVTLTYSMQQAGVNMPEKVAQMGGNDVTVEEFRGYTVKLWVKEIIPPSASSASPTVVINIRIVH